MFVDFIAKAIEIKVCNLCRVGGEGGAFLFSNCAVNKWLLIMQMQMVEATSNCQLPHDSSSKGSCRYTERERERERIETVAYFFGLSVSLMKCSLLWWLKFLQLCCAYESAPPLFSLQPLGSSLCMSLSPSDSYVNQQPDNRWQLNSIRLDSPTVDSPHRWRWGWCKVCGFVCSHTARQFT